MLCLPISIVKHFPDQHFSLALLTELVTRAGIIPLRRPVEAYWRADLYVA